MEYQLALSPDLGLSAEDFVNAWNEDEEARSIAEARLAPSTSTHYEPILIVILIGVGTGLAANAITEFVKKALAKRNVHKPVKVTDVSKPDSAARQITVTVTITDGTKE